MKGKHLRVGKKLAICISFTLLVVLFYGCHLLLREQSARTPEAWKQAVGDSAISITLDPDIPTKMERHPERLRRILLTCQARVSVDSGVEMKVRSWIPLPDTTADQEVAKLTIKASVPYRSTRDKDFHNRILYLEGPVTRDHPFEVTYQCEVTRREAACGKGREGPETELFLKPRGLVIVDEDIRALATTITADRKEVMDKAYAIYQHVLNSMAYAKVGTGWGKGSTKFACVACYGNCTDYHSLFLSLCRASGIPAKFEIGHVLPTDEKDGVLSGYHCWAKFQLPDGGWLPVDISEADKDHTKAGYYFGCLDENRIHFTTGREIVLAPPAEDPVNYFVTPHAELDGEETPVEWSVSFVDRKAN